MFHFPSSIPPNTYHKRNVEMRVVTYIVWVFSSLVLLADGFHFPNRLVRQTQTPTRQLPSMPSIDTEEMARGKLALKMSVVRDPKVGIKVLDARFRKATKQLATLGPASSSIEMIEKLFLSGADVFRLNFSHGEHVQKAELVDHIRAVEAKYNHPITILADLQGPKLRVGTFASSNGVMLADGQEFTFDLNTELSGNEQRVGMPHPEILNTLQKGDTLLLDDGKLRM